MIGEGYKSLYKKTTTYEQNRNANKVSGRNTSLFEEGLVISETINTYAIIYTLIFILYIVVLRRKSKNSYYLIFDFFNQNTVKKRK